MNLDKETQGSFKVFAIWIVVLWLLTPVLVVSTTGIYNKIYTHHFAKTADSNTNLLLTPGGFGDMYNATNTLFTGLAFLAALLALLTQQRELKNQAKAQIESARMQNQQTEAIIKQLQTMQDKAEFDKKTARMMAEPLFQSADAGKPIMISGVLQMGKTAHFFNAGETVRRLRIDHKFGDGVTISITPNDILRADQEGTIKIQTSEPYNLGNVEFDIRYTTRLGETKSQHFIIQRSSYALEKIEEDLT